ncbi:MAG: amidohydrolase family protein [Methylococcales bacterium]|nr:amidohydrolase family protein [Methylococcales bacterium]
MIIHKLKPLLLALSLVATSAIAEETPPQTLLIHAARVFDGTDFKSDTSVLVVDGKVTQIDKREAFKNTTAKEIDLGDATLLPGFIELHAHLNYRHIPAETVLRHGITTLRDVGGPIQQPMGGDGSLRVLTSGPIITATDGYPIVNMGADNIAVAVNTEEEARATVRQLVKDGAVVIKVALEPGNESGAPWSGGHGHHEHASAESKHSHHKPAHAAKALWPLLPLNVVKAIVSEAHSLNRKVTAHLAEEKGARLALEAGVDEWAHMPCDAIPESLLKKAVAQKVKVISTLDTLSKCTGLAHNSKILSGLGAEFLYGAEIAHPDIPWGIDANELMLMMHLANMPMLDVLRSATSKAGAYLDIPLLGTLQANAPADLIAIKGDIKESFKPLEYPDLVISGGKIVVNNFVK